MRTELFVLSENRHLQSHISSFTSRRNVILFAIVIATSTILAVISYENYSSGSKEITELAEDDIKSTTRITAHDLSNIMTQRLRIVGSQLQTLAESPIIQEFEIERGMSIINDRQATTAELTEFYMWLDQDGKILWISNLNQTAYEQNRATDLSSREYFSNPKDMGEKYFSRILISNDGIPRSYISMPVVGVEDMEFKGVVVAGMRSTTLGELLRSDLAPGTESLVSLIDKNGVILYSRDPSFIGKDIFGQEIQNAIAQQISGQEVDLLNNVLQRALQGNSGIEDITISGRPNTIAYNPITFDGKFVMTLYVTSPHILADNAQTIISQQQTLSIAIIVAVTAIAAIITILVLNWNRQLDIIVQKRTVALRDSNRQLEEANVQLKAHDAMQKEFINIAAHELRTPTQAILGYSDLIESGYGLGERDMQGIIRNAKRLERLTEDILDVTRIESNTLRLKKERFSLNDLISSLINDVQTRGSNTDKEIKFYFGSKYDAVIVDADKSRLSQAISNILNNAVKFSEETGGTISVSVEKSNDGQVIVRIRDEGVGIHPDIIPRLFTKFATKSERGTGLGLFISRNIMEAHGGRMWAENNKDGKGATFALSLPAS